MSMMNNSLVEVMDVINRPMTNQYSVLQDTLRQSQLASKELYLSNAKSCDGKDPTNLVHGLMMFLGWPLFLVKIHQK